MDFSQSAASTRSRESPHRFGAVVPGRHAKAKLGDQNDPSAAEWVRAITLIQHRGILETAIDTTLIVIGEHPKSRDKSGCYR
jgi:hypothetical protein